MSTSRPRGELARAASASNVNFPVDRSGIREPATPGASRSRGRSNLDTWTVEQRPSEKPLWAQRCSGLSFVAVCGRRDTLPVACESEEVCMTSLHTVLANVQLQELEATNRGWAAGRSCRRPGSCRQWSFSWRDGDRWVAACSRPWPGSRRRALRRLTLPAPIGSAPLEPGRALPLAVLEDLFRPTGPLGQGCRETSRRTTPRG
jgi:hypothetical protein